MKPNRKANMMSPRVRICPAMIRCDGNVLQPNMEMCGACRKHQRPKAVKKELRGERHVMYEESRAKH